MALRLALKNAGAASVSVSVSGSRTFFTGPFRLVTQDELSVNIQKQSEKDRSVSSNKGSETQEYAGKWYRWKKVNDYYCLKADMPGLDKDNVKVTVDQENNLVISGELDGGDETDVKKTYSKAFLLQPKFHKLDGIKAEMKNGVLKVTVPEVQEEEKKVMNINVE